jgi:hypothetical protein
MSTQHTPGPWHWFGNARNNDVYLATIHSGHRYVMGFKRWGMRGAQPMFQPDGRGLVPAESLLKFEVGDRSVTGYDAAKADESVYRYDICRINCADAHLIAAAPELLEAAPDAVDLLEEYAEFVRSTVPYEELERHPYLPSIEDAASKLRAAIAKARGQS